MRGPKRASRIRKMFNLAKEDDVRHYVKIYGKKVGAPCCCFVLLLRVPLGGWGGHSASGAPLRVKIYGKKVWACLVGWAGAVRCGAVRSGAGQDAKWRGGTK